LGNPKDRVTNNLVALGSAAVITVYAAGFVRTRPAAQRFAQQAERRPAPATHTAAETPASTPSPVDRQEAPPSPSKPTAEPTVDKKLPKGPASDTRSMAPPKRPMVVATSPARATDTVANPVPTQQTATSAPVEPVAAAVATTTPATPAAPAPAHDSSRTATAAVAPAAPDSTNKEKPKLKDGIFFGWGTSRHGDIQAGLEVKNGRIISAFISECLTQYSCSWISMLPPQVIARQSPEVDFVSGATQSTNAFYYAVVDALKKAK